MKKSGKKDLQKKYSRLKLEALIGSGIVIILLITGASVTLFGPDDYIKKIDQKTDREIVCNKPYIFFENGCCLDTNRNHICDDDEKEKFGTPASPPAAPPPSLPPTTELVTETSVVGESLVCNRPYIRHGTSCCLDDNDDHICDSDERDVLPTLILGCTDAEASNYNVDATSDDGSCEYELARGCDTGETLCGDSCVNTQTHPENCGTCGNVCILRRFCETGICVDLRTTEDECPVASQTYCMGIGCVNLQTDEDNCGNCATTCMPDQSCITGSCQAEEEETPAAPYCAGLGRSSSHPGGCCEGLVPIAGLCVSPSAGVENTAALCADGIDNDRDGLIDAIDNDCRRQSCGTKSGYVWIWSHLLGENQNIAPPANAAGQRRIGCCRTNQCRTIEGVCKDYDTYYTDEYICGDNNNWDRCSSTVKLDIDSDGGDYQCSGSPRKWSLIRSYEPAMFCADGLDNDRDGYTDGQDSDCDGKLCGIDSTYPHTTKVWVWSKIPPYDETDPPARIACCYSNQCTNTAEECINYDARYVTSGGNKEFICGDDNNWDRCGPLNIMDPDSRYNKFHSVPPTEYGISDGGDYECMGNSDPDVWVPYS